MPNLPLISVVMIAYNKADCIDEAIKGVISQRGDFTIELIIMDDCSTDATPEIISRWHKRYPDIIRQVRNPRNLGLQGNYMAGFKLCRGKYMAICDADDYWFCHTKLARQTAYMEANPGCAITFHRMVNYYEQSGEMSLSNGNTPTDSTLATLSRSNYITNSSVVYRRELVDLHTLPAWLATVTSPDYAMHMFYASYGSIHFFRRPMGVYRKAAGSAWSMTGEYKRQKMALDVRRHLISYLSSHAEAVEGLRDSSAAILRSMASSAETTEQLDYVKDTALQMALEVDVPSTPQLTTHHTRRPSALSRLRGLVSRFIPRPRP